MASQPSGIAPIFLVQDVVRAAEYYRDKMGFEIGPYFLDPPVFVIIQRDGVAIQLTRMDRGRGGSNRNWKDEAYDAYIWVKDLDGLHREFTAKKAQICAAPALKEYGMKEMDVRD